MPKLDSFCDCQMITFGRVIRDARVNFGVLLCLAATPVYMETDNPQANRYPPVTLIQRYLKIIAPEMCFFLVRDTS